MDLITEEDFFKKGVSIAYIDNTLEDLESVRKIIEGGILELGIKNA